MLRALRPTGDVALASHKSAEKRARQDARRRERNRTIRGATRTAVKQVRSDLDAGASDPLARARSAESALRRAASKGVIPKRRASRLTSRLAKRAARQASKRR
jgi:small subunit ribosomal protein S20